MGAPADSGEVAEHIAAGRAALARAEWESARRSFELALTLEDAPEAHEGLSWAAWWLDDAEVLLAARERAYLGFRDAGDRAAAARLASWLANDITDFTGEVAVAQGWLRRAARLLEGLEPGPEHGWLYIHEAERLLSDNDTAGARELGARAAELGQRLGLVGLQMVGVATEGLALVTEGRAAEGVPRMDEAAAAALGGEFEQAFPTVWCCCYTIYACERLGDFDRAAQWCNRFEAWTDRMRIPFANRFCRVHHAGILVRRGAWEEAEAELSESAEALARTRPPYVAEATARLAELRRRQGRLDEAATIYEVVAAEPAALLGLGELCLDRGDAAGARDRAEQYLRETPASARALRAPGLELLVRANVAGGWLGEAARPLAELRGLANMIATEALRASAEFACGVFAATAGDGEAARVALEGAVLCYRRSGAPFEEGRARLELAGTLRSLGRDAPADSEIEAALRIFRDIGATRDVERSEAALAVGATGSALGGPGSKPLDTLTTREREVLALVAGGLTNELIAERLVISEHTVKRHVANILRRLDLPSRAAAAALAGRHGLGSPNEGA